MTVQKIAKILTEFKDFDESKINRDTTFEEIGLDSLDIVDLVMKLEDEFSVEIPMDGNLKTIGNIVDFIESAK